MAAWEVAESVGGTDLAGTYSGGGVASITIGATSGNDRISQAYDHLYVSFSSRSGYSAYYSSLEIRVNGDGNNNYSYTRLYTTKNTSWGASSKVYSDNSSSSAELPGDYVTGNSAEADTFGHLGMWLMNYSSTTTRKPMLVRSLAPNADGADDRGAITLSAGMWQGADAITSIRFKPYSSGNFRTGTSWVIYGINGAS